MILDKYKAYPFPLENALNSVIISMEFILRSDFREMLTASQFARTVNGKWGLHESKAVLILKFEV